MKILIATDCYIFNLGGITASVLALCAGLRRLGHEVRTLSLSDSRRSFRKGEDCFIGSFPALYYPGMRASFKRRDPLLDELAAWGPDVIHAQTEGSARRLATGIMKRCGAPMVMTCHTDYGYFVFGKGRDLAPVRAVMRAAGRILYARAAKVTVPSRKAAGFPFLDSVRGRLTVVPNGMEIEKYRKPLSAEARQAFRGSLGIGADAPVLLSVTRLSREKNIQEIVTCLPGLVEKAPGVKYLVVGDGPYRKRLEKEADRLRVRGSVVFAGRIPSDEVWRYYAAGDVFVSASAFEVHSMSYLEALACGLPLLCRADDALEGVLEHGWNGFSYHSREEFLDFALRLTGEAALRERMGERSSGMSERFGADAFANAMSGVYMDAIRVKGERTDG